MPKLLVIAVMVGLSLGVGLVARAGVSAWLEWIDEPLRQPPDLHLVRPAVTGGATGQRPPTSTRGRTPLRSRIVDPADAEPISSVADRYLTVWMRRVPPRRGRRR